MSFGYSGSMLVTRGTPFSLSSTTYYSFKINELCRIGIDGNPLIEFKEGEEFIVRGGSSYIFDRNTKISLSYPEVPTLEATQQKINSKQKNFSSAAGTYFPVAAIVSDRALTSYDVFAMAEVYTASTVSGVIFRIRYGGTVLSSASYNFTAGIVQYITTSATGLSTAIPKNGVITLEIEGSGANTYISYYEDTVFRVVDTA